MSAAGRPRPDGRKKGMGLDAAALPKGVEIRGSIRAGDERILTPDAIGFVVALERKFGAERKRLLARRAEVQAKLDQGWKPEFLAETRQIRDSDWTVAPIPRDL